MTDMGNRKLPVADMWKDCNAENTNLKGGSNNRGRSSQYSENLESKLLEGGKLNARKSL